MYVYSMCNSIKCSGLIYYTNNNTLLYVCVSGTIKYHIV